MLEPPKFLEKIGPYYKTVYNRVEANLDVYTNRFKGTDNIFGCGDLSRWDSPNLEIRHIQRGQM